jgi:hypothetical protein
MLVLKRVGIWVKKKTCRICTSFKSERIKELKANKSTTVPVHAINAYGGLKIELHSFSSFTLYAISGQVHGPAVLLPRIQPAISSHGMVMKRLAAGTVGIFWTRFRSY